MRRLLLGVEAVTLDENLGCNEELQSLLSTFREKLVQTFRDPIPMQLQGTARHTLLPTQRVFWTVTGEVKEPSVITKYQHEGVRILKESYYYLGHCNEQKFKYFAAATLMKQEKYCPPRASVAAYDRLVIDDFVSILLSREEHAELLAVAEAGMGEQHIFQVKGFISTDNGDAFVLLHSLIKGTPQTEYMLSETPTIQVAKLSTTVRRVAALHVCDRRCGLIASGLFTTICHNPANKRYVILTAREGYPPHMG